jgi:thiamine-phosphate pyrophosphorylase
MYENLIAVTNRTLCTRDYLTQIERICQQHPHAVLLREKDLSREEYTQLARQVEEICSYYRVPLIIHNFAESAKELHIPRLHLPISQLRQLKKAQEWECLGTSCHSMEQLEEALSLGVTYVFLGNVFETSCKPGVPANGLELLRQVCQRSTVPVYAIGGITPERLPAVLESGAAGGCMMSGFMQL